MAGKRARRATSPARRLGTTFYRGLVIVSAIIVASYCVFRIMARPPQVDNTPPAYTAATPLPGSSPGPSAQAQPAATPQQPVWERKAYTYTFLLAASDQSSGNTDTMMVATYDTVNQTVGLVSLPRDTLINGVRESNGRHFYKLNGTCAYNGMDALKEEAGKILGFPIDFYIKVNVRGFVRLVDAVGGVDFYVPVDMNYDDPTQDLHIHFNKGMQWLSGSDALKVARCRQNSYIDDEGQVHTYDAYPNADIGRTGTQRDLLMAVLKKAVTNPQKLPEYVNIFTENVDTDLSATDIAYFVSKAPGLDFSSGITTSVLPGDGMVRYQGWSYCYQLYPDQVLEIVNTQGLNPYTTDITADMLDIFQVQ